MKADQERVKDLVTETVTVLCRNGLQHHKTLTVQGVIGITIDDSEVFLICINESSSSRAVSVSDATAKGDVSCQASGTLHSCSPRENRSLKSQRTNTRHKLNKSEMTRRCRAGRGKRAAFQPQFRAIPPSSLESSSTLPQ